MRPWHRSQNERRVCVYLIKAYETKLFPQVCHDTEVARRHLEQERQVGGRHDVNSAIYIFVCKKAMQIPKDKTCGMMS